MQMPAFPHQHHVRFTLDFPNLPTASPFVLLPPSTLDQARDVATASSCFPCYDNPFEVTTIIPEEITPVYSAGISTITSVTTTPTPEDTSMLESSRTVPSPDIKMTSPSSLAQRSEVASRTQCSVEKKRKETHQCSSGSAFSEDAKEATSKKPRKRRGAAKEAKEKAPPEPPTAYIHVRARRGEATDSHSLAERVRREKIRQRMKTLQGLVPGCDKVVGKALLLDEIINYVLSLQNQVEFLSMKLAFVNSMICEPGLDFDDNNIFLPEDAGGSDASKLQKSENMSPAPSHVQRTGDIQPTAFADAANNHTVQHTSLFFLPHAEGPSYSFPYQVFH